MHKLILELTSSYIMIQCSAESHCNTEKNTNLAKSILLFRHMLSIVLYNAIRKKIKCPSVQFIGNFLFCILEPECLLRSPETNYSAQHENQVVLPVKKLCPIFRQGDIAKTQT